MTAQDDVHARVAEHLHPGETFQAAIWVTRVHVAPTGGEIARQELNPKRLAESIALEAAGIDNAHTGPDGSSGNRAGVIDGPPGSQAAELDARLPADRGARLLALTDQRLIMFAKVPEPRPESLLSIPGWLLRRAREAADDAQFRPAAGPLRPLLAQWQGRRPVAAGLAERRLHLAFADGSRLAVITPHALAGSFIAALTS
ncbi:hypothetical protein [Actinoplanes teichomyceticus]|uniref:Uncharacterized protein n=1 Tax=Actinoplanes teichomyceticus TaxID=1867 RepID=A0A561WNN8_ACTTI|nr:hypothetical protein [Actinoplanes teichomyceticus]TWG25486.1 hypothetical protein FHX34_101455 [Actinoplanes teichomyceticus]GIF10555.1 hypothetical protein Ate01nite_05870 [Actinoplanes teichomyceticus]